ncbi:MAG: ATP-binding cassette domain-containing protein [Levilactobacillus sp.]|jgi:putative ABC transport system ATP-binding protein|uniref:ATP-binding cassette domain-containing protein n=1 Tax=Levilactobacillus suantsaiihabitans TaxID=2487722 RepID=A0A4Z0JE37_9LACO|nr:MULTISPECIES: ATP-binding cassette domain-containing protein [Levilactobacillus]MCH4123659.1 ATP-binding cassette domain-containing protein [Levilactobacillus sp.]MCI1553757.1 ATP-binding cassette domain-containing protein [Levilactobacillus sp.]MCI1599524.1 ATP-binding cassette domain-containing protein [Levilactobacillus sp.]TGD20199.1 ATP-binding cassette domain-containing protein [Levilactobacillus suantsaiihabitans]
MTKPLLELKDVVLKVNRNTPEEITILNKLNLTINAGDFITVLGSNGAGKSTLFNAIGGDLSIDSGQILLNGHDIAHESVEKRTRFLARVFQDPKLGTAPRMTVAENLLLAERRGQRRGLMPRGLKHHLAHYQELTATMHNGLDQRLTTATGNLSGGQRQALSFLMATLKRPEILLLDEHTAALDPRTGQDLMHLTNERVAQDQLTCLMITHHMEDALTYGNRLIVLHHGQVTYDVAGAEKQALTSEQLYSFFAEIE